MKTLQKIQDAVGVDLPVLLKAKMALSNGAKTLWFQGQAIDRFVESNADKGKGAANIPVVLEFQREAKTAYEALSQYQASTPAPRRTESIGPLQSRSSPALKQEVLAPPAIKQEVMAAPTSTAAPQQAPTRRQQQVMQAPANQTGGSASAKRKLDPQSSSDGPAKRSRGGLSERLVRNSSSPVPITPNNRHRDPPKTPRAAPSQFQTQTPPTGKLQKDSAAQAPNRTQSQPKRMSQGGQGAAINVDPRGPLEERLAFASQVKGGTSRGGGSSQAGPSRASGSSGGRPTGGR